MPQKGKAKQVARPIPPLTKELPLPKRLSGIADASNGRHPTWRLSFLDLDHEGSWSWQVPTADLHDIVRFLQEMERLTWTEVFAQLAGSKKGSHRKHHAMPAEQLCAEAQRRLQHLRLDDFDELFRFRLGNKRRLWGILDAEIFYPLWWDAEHKVYPLEPE
jgi:hypothetical protein